MIFDEDQRRILELTSGNHKVLAPPGSGKTQLLSQRVCRAVEQGVDPEDMICLTFTNRAALNMLERIPARCRGVFVGNFHVFGIRQLMGMGVFPLGSAVLDEEDAHLFVVDALDSILKKITFSFRNNIAKRWNHAQLIELVKGFSRLKTQEQLKLDFAVTEETHRLVFGGVKAFAALKKKDSQLFSLLNKAHSLYVRHKTETMVLDFDDILAETLHHLRRMNNLDNGRIFSWVQVDEAQDLNAIQWAILNEIINKQSHLVVLGDIQQSIFSFMGSSLMRFEKETTNFKIHRLKKNYRSPSYLLRFFRHYANIALDTLIEIDSHNTTDVRGDGMQIITYHSDLAERAGLVKNIIPCCLSDEMGSVAVLTRTNINAAVLSAALTKQNIRHFLVSTFDVLRSRNAKDFMAVLSILFQPEDRVAWMRLFKIFAKIKTLKEARKIVNELFAASINIWDLLASDGDLSARPLAALSYQMRRGELVVFDVETTGLDVDNVDIIQIAAAIFKRGKITKELNLYLKTNQPLEGSVEIHKITKETLRTRGKNRKQALKEFLEFIGERPLAAHNLDFDLQVLQANLKREKLHLLDDKRALFCSLKGARTLYPKAPKHTLESLLSYLKIKGTNSHDAIEDVRAAGYLIARMAKDERKIGRLCARTIKKHEKTLLKLNLFFAPLFEEANLRGKEVVQFGQLFKLFVQHVNVVKPNYDWNYADEVNSKLIRHMDTTCEPERLSKLLNKHLRRYQHYRESDLILSKDNLVVSTIHRAKGLEFDTVIIPSAVDKNYPTVNAMLSGKPEALQEEARIFYVGITRAKRKLIITAYKWYSGPGRPGNRRRTSFMRGMNPHFDVLEG